jgi:hypothetical protein
MSTLAFTKAHIGYQADVDPDTGVTRWVIVNTSPKRWEIISITSMGERRRHGAAHTFREAKEAVNRWHQENLTRVSASR